MNPAHPVILSAAKNPQPTRRMWKMNHHTPCHSERSEESTANAPDGEFVARAPSESAA